MHSAQFTTQENSTNHTKETARLALQKLNTALSTCLEPRNIDLVIQGTEERITLPPETIKLLRKILTNTAAGRPVDIVPVKTELTTQQAADLLNVSRPHVVKLINKGILKGHKVGTHRRVYAADVEEYKHHRRIKQRAAADELTSLSEELGLYE